MRRLQPRAYHARAGRGGTRRRGREAAAERGAENHRRGPSGRGQRLRDAGGERGAGGQRLRVRVRMGQRGRGRTAVAECGWGSAVRGRAWAASAGCGWAARRAGSGCGMRVGSAVRGRGSCGQRGARRGRRACAPPQPRSKGQADRERMVRRPAAMGFRGWAPLSSGYQERPPGTSSRAPGARTAPGAEVWRQWIRSSAAGRTPWSAGRSRRSPARRWTTPPWSRGWCTTGGSGG